MLSGGLALGVIGRRSNLGLIHISFDARRACGSAWALAPYRTRYAGTTRSIIAYLRVYETGFYDPFSPRRRPTLVLTPTFDALSSWDGRAAMCGGCGRVVSTQRADTRPFAPAHSTFPNRCRVGPLKHEKYVDSPLGAQPRHLPKQVRVGPL